MEYKFIGNKKVKLAKSNLVITCDVFLSLSNETYVRYKTGFGRYDYEKCEMV
jgi:hypothetical protein